MKKWTYLVAACLLAGATPVFTGCVDNDEPAGIEQLRGAKAELIKAQMALVEAKAVVKRAEEAKVKAEADVLSAKAAILEAYARKQEAWADAAEDSAAYIEQMCNLKIQEETARVEASINYWKAEAAKSEAAYQEALKSIELAKLTLSADQWGKLQHYTDALDDAKWWVDKYQGDYVKALDAYTKAYRNYTDDQANTEYKNQLARNVRNDSVSLEYAKKALAEAQEVAAKPIEATAWEEEKKALEEQLEQLKIEDANLKVIGAKFDAEHAEELQAMTDSLNKAVSYGAKVVYEDKEGVQKVVGPGSTTGAGLKISAYDFSSETDMFDGVQIEVNVPEGEYFYNNYVENMEAITEGETSVEKLARQGIEPFVTLNKFDKAIWEANLFTLNDNEEQWKYNDIARLNADLTEVQKEYEAAYAEWNSVKNAYNHVAAVTNPTELAVGKTLNEAITAYNTAAAANSTAIANLATAEKTFIEALKKADATATSTADYTRIKTVLDAEVTTQTANVTDKKTLYDAAVTILEATKADGSSTQDEIAAAQKDVDDALKALNEANTLLATAQANQAAVVNANTAYNTAASTVNDTTDASGNTVKGTKSKAEDAYWTVAAAYQAYVAYLTGVSLWDFDDYDYLGTVTEVVKEGTGLADKDGNTYVATMDATKVLEVSQDQLMGVLRTASQKVWGTAWLRTDDQTRLLPVTQEEVDANIAEVYAEQNQGETIPEYLIQFNYSIGYGLFGQTLSLKAAIERANEYLKGGDAEIKRIVDEITAMKTKLQEEIDANNAMVKKLVDDFLVANDAYNEAYQTEVGELIEANEAAQSELVPVINALKGAIEGYLNTQAGSIVGGQYVGTPTSVEALKDRLAQIVTQCEFQVIDAEEKLQIAIERVEKFETEGTDGQKTLYYALEDAQTDLDRAKEKLEAAQAEYDAANAELQAILDALSSSSEE